MTFVDITGRAYQPSGGSNDISNYMKTSLAHASFVDETGDILKGNIDMANHKIINIANPINAQDASTKSYVDSQDAETRTMLVNDFISRGNNFKELQTFWKGIDLKNTKITNLSTPTLSTDAATKSYVDAQRAEAMAYANSHNKEIINSLNKQFENGINMENKKVYNLANPTEPKDAVNKEYADNKLHESKLNLDHSLRTTMVNVDATINQKLLEESTKINKHMEGKIDKDRNINMNGNRITNLGIVEEGLDVVNKMYVDLEISKIHATISSDRQHVESLFATREAKGNASVKALEMIPSKLIYTEYYFNENGAKVVFKENETIYNKLRGNIIS